RRRQQPRRPPLAKIRPDSTCALSRASQLSINSPIHCACAGSLCEVLEGLKPGGSYRYGDTSVSPGGTKSGVFSCPNSHAVTISYRWLIIVSLAHSWWGKRVSSFEALNQHCKPQNECQR